MPLLGPLSPHEQRRVDEYLAKAAQADAMASASQGPLRTQQLALDSRKLSRPGRRDRRAVQAIATRTFGVTDTCVGVSPDKRVTLSKDMQIAIILDPIERDMNFPNCASLSLGRTRGIAWKRRRAAKS